MDSEINWGKVVGWGAFVVFLIIVIFTVIPFGTVGTGERGVVTRFGAPTGEVKGEGLYWRKPFVEKIIDVKVNVQSTTAEASAASKDLQTVHTKVQLNYSVNPEKVVELYRAMKKDYDSILIHPALQESIKSATAKYTAEELVTKRPAVREEIVTLLREKLSPHGIQVGEFNIVDFAFSPEFDKAIELKVKAEQDALAAKNVLEQRKYEAEQVVVKAQADAEAIRIQAQAITQQGGKDYVQLKAIEKWNGSLPNQMIPGSTVPFLELNR